MSKVFLGGTCGNSTWRDALIPHLEQAGIEYFNPVVDDWTEECIAEEERQKVICDKHLYVITSEMTGVYSIAEAVYDACKGDHQVYLYVYEEGFDPHQVKSLKATLNLIANEVTHSQIFWGDMEEVAPIIAEELAGT